jgi:hypothetical protein
MKLTNKQLRHIVKEEVEKAFANKEDLEEAAPLVVAAGRSAGAYALEKILTKQGREELAELLEILPDLIISMCDIPENLTSDSRISKLGSLMAKSCKTLSWLNPAHTVYKAAAYILRNIDDDQAAAIAGTAEEVSADIQDSEEV